MSGPSPWVLTKLPLGGNLVRTYQLRAPNVCALAKTCCNWPEPQGDIPQLGLFGGNHVKANLRYLEKISWTKFLKSVASFIASQWVGDISMGWKLGRRLVHQVDQQLGCELELPVGEKG